MIHEVGDEVLVNASHHPGRRRYGRKAKVLDVAINNAGKVIGYRLLIDARSVKATCLRGVHVLPPDRIERNLTKDPYGAR